MRSRARVAWLQCPEEMLLVQGRIRKLDQGVEQRTIVRPLADGSCLAFQIGLQFRRFYALQPRASDILSGARGVCVCYQHGRLRASARDSGLSLRIRS